MEITIINIMQFDRGFVLKSSEVLVAGNTYYLRINDGLQAVDKIYNVVNQGDMIIDQWGSYIPADGNVCFTLSDIIFSCPSLNVTLEVM